MEITNLHNLPLPLLRAVTKDPYTGGRHGHISVTGLIQPPRIRQLMLRHAHEVEVDASERLWILLGSAVHVVLERGEDRQAEELQEERLTVEIAGCRVTGQPDLWSAPARLDDYKITSVWAVINGVKPEWEAQLNCYAYLYRQAGFPVEELFIDAIFRDWSRNLAKQGGNYPPIGAQVVPVPLWPDQEINDYLHSRVSDHLFAETLADPCLPECTPEERWQRPAQWAVMKEGNKKASKLCDSLEEAQRELAERRQAKPKDKFCIVERPGSFPRCEDYCPVNKWCSQYQPALPVEEAA